MLGRGVGDFHVELFLGEEGTAAFTEVLEAMELSFCVAAQVRVEKDESLREKTNDKRVKEWLQSRIIWINNLVFNISLVATLVTVALHSSPKVG